MPGIKNTTTKSLTLDATEVAQLLGISKRTVYRLLDAGQIPKPIKLGNVIWSDR